MLQFWKTEFFVFLILYHMYNIQFFFFLEKLLIITTGVVGWNPEYSVLMEKKLAYLYVLSCGKHLKKECYTILLIL